MQPQLSQGGSWRGPIGNGRKLPRVLLTTLCPMARKIERRASGSGILTRTGAKSILASAHRRDLELCLQLEREVTNNRSAKSRRQDNTTLPECQEDDGKPDEGAAGREHLERECHSPACHERICENDREPNSMDKCFLKWVQEGQEMPVAWDRVRTFVCSFL
jgi:hypothetical protein